MAPQTGTSSLTAALAAGAALPPPWMPPSAVLPVPDFAAGLLGDLGAAPGRWLGPVAVLALVCAVLLGVGARKALERGTEARGAGRR